MFDEILKMSYSAIRDSNKKVESLDSIRKIITFKDADDIDAYSTNSDTIIYFDITVDTTPLLVVERIALRDVKLKKLKAFIADWNLQQSAYIAHIELERLRRYVSIVIVSRDIHNKLLEVT